MKKIKEIISTTKIKGLADYFNLYKKIGEEVKKRQLSDKKTVKIAILSSFTIGGIKEVLSVKCCGLGIFADIYIGEYNQYPQEILNPESSLYKFNPDLIILFIDTKSVLGEEYFLPYQVSDEQRKEFIDTKLKELQSLIQKIKEKSSAKIILHNFEIPLYSPLGIAEQKQEFGFLESLQLLNSNLRNTFKNDSQVFVFDYDSFCSKIGKEKIVDYKMYYLGDMKLDLQLMPRLGDEYLSYLKPLLSLTKKCVVLDLDNILWGGIIGEDGLEGIKLGPNPEGRPFLEFQKYLLSLFNRGVILAINSKNNSTDVFEVFQKHPHMVLKEEHFASMKINWSDKVSNMRAIAKELNIGIDTFVFIDDEKSNREMIKQAFPEILVVDLPEDPSLYVKALTEINDFNTFQITEEDKKKGKIYAEQREREELRESVSDITEYLRKLEMVVTIEKANNFNIPRISQLTQKTNQFNTTTKRYLEEDIKRLAQSNNYLVFSAKIEDKFGDNGITAAVIVEKGTNKWRIDTFLLSCRVIGRRVEETLLAYILKEARKERVATLIGEFIPTKKNAPARDFYKNNNFQLVGEENGIEIWKYDLAKEYKFPDFIKVIES